jgi:hypothetical protein
MQASNENIREVVKILMSQISLGWDYFAVAKFVYEAYGNARVAGGHAILTRTYETCWDASILAVSKVLDNHKDSLSIKYLLNYFDSVPMQYPGLTRDALRKQIAEHRAEVADIEAHIPGIWDERDRIVAHLDRKHAYAPASVRSSPPVEMDDLHSAIRALRRIMLVYNQQWQALGISIDSSQEIWDDLEKILRLLSEDGQKAA